MANNVKKVWASGKAVVNAWLAIPSGFSAEVIAQCGFDSVTVDMQHGVQDYQSMVQCFQAMHAHPVTPMVRVPWNEPGIIGKVLDAGAYGVICPMINTPQEAKNLVSYSKYPPMGVRSNGPIRSGMYGSAGTYQQTANEEIVLLPMMETKTAVGNMEAILDVEGINGVYIGPSDLGFSYGLVPKLDRDEPEILKIYEKIVKECGKRNLYPGIHCSGADGAVRAINMGFKLVTLSNESGLMATYAKMQIAQTRKEFGRARRESDSFSLAPLLRGEGRGEGRFPRMLCQQFDAVPCPSPGAARRPLPVKNGERLRTNKETPHGPRPP